MLNIVLICFVFFHLYALSSKWTFLKKNPVVDKENISESQKHMKAIREQTCKNDYRECLLIALMLDYLKRRKLSVFKFSCLPWLDIFRGQKQL